MDSRSVRPAAVAGAFYPGDAQELRDTVDALLAAAPVAKSKGQLRALICPHAGYAYSGATAAYGYASLGGAAAGFSRVGAAPWQRVVVFGPTHRVAVRGMAVPSVDAFATPLGEMPIDAELRDWALTRPAVVMDDASHRLEHSIEVQLPFLQRQCPGATVLPVAVGDVAPAAVAALMAGLLARGDTLLVISSDLSHFHAHREAEQIDKASVATMLAGEATLNHQQACGATPVNALLLAARQCHLHPELLYRCNSGDASGDRSRVVGYATLAFYESTGAV